MSDSLLLRSVSARVTLFRPDLVTRMFSGLSRPLGLSLHSAFLQTLTGILQLWVRDSADWVWAAAARTITQQALGNLYQQALSVIGEHLLLPVLGRVLKRDCFFVYRHRRPTLFKGSGMLRCRNFCFQRLGFMKLRIWCKMWGGPKGKMDNSMTLSNVWCKLTGFFFWTKTIKKSWSSWIYFTE